MNILVLSANIQYINQKYAQNVRSLWSAHPVRKIGQEVDLDNLNVQVAIKSMSQEIFLGKNWLYLILFL